MKLTQMLQTLSPDGAVQCSRHFLLSVPTSTGWLDEQAGERPRVQSAEEDFYQVGHPQASLYYKFKIHAKHLQVSLVHDNKVSQIQKHMALFFSQWWKKYE